MRPVRLLVALSATAVVFAGSPPAHAAGGLVDGGFDAGGTTCVWANASTSDVPPNPLTIDHTTIQSSCGNPWANDPTWTFDDTNGTASTPEIDVTATVLGVTCGYKVTNILLHRQEMTRTYSGGPFTGTKSSGGFLCPSSETVDSITVTFH